MNGPIEIRATGVDRGSDVLVARRRAAGAVGPPRPRRPPGVGHRAVDQHAHVPGHAVLVRVLRRDGGVGADQLRVLRLRAGRVVEGLGLLDAGPWTDATVLSTTIPDDYRVARAPTRTGTGRSAR